MYLLCLNNLGILNYENQRLSGEHSFLDKLTKYFEKDAIVFDVGANVGRYSNYIAKLKPETKIYAFEPHPKTFKVLEKNSQLNGYTALQFGCGHKPTKLKLYDYKERDGSSHASLYKDVIQDIHDGNPTEHIVDVIDLDSFVIEKNISNITLLKIDVEGNEYAVLKGLKQSIDNDKVEIIHWEFNNMNVISRTFFKDFYVFLSKYDIYRMLPHSLIPLGEYKPIFCEIYVFQNLVAIHKDSKFQP